MIIKKFTGKTEAEATEAAKKELGNGLVIMNVREVKKKGLFSFLSPKQIEVTAALEDESPQRSVVNSLNPYGSFRGRCRYGEDCIDEKQHGKYRKKAG